MDANFWMPFWFTVWAMLVLAGVIYVHRAASRDERARFDRDLMKRALYQIAQGVVDPKGAAKETLKEVGEPTP